MSSVNKKAKVEQTVTHGGATTTVVNSKEQLMRSVMSCMLWEDTFYENGVSIAERIESLVPNVKPEDVYNIAVNAREKSKLRHAPLLLARVMSRLNTHKHLVSDLLSKIIKRPDELTEFLAIYWKDKKQPLSNQVKKGLASAFVKFDEHSLAKYNRDNAVKLRDVLFLVHPKPDSQEKQEIWNRLVAKQLKTPDTWEVEISAKGNNRESWERLLREKKLGALALIRNLRNMGEVGVDANLIREALNSANFSDVLPFRFVAAAKAAPRYESDIDTVFLKTTRQKEKLPGKTVFIIDVSGSMYGGAISAMSDMNRALAAASLGAIGRECCEEVAVYATAGNDYTQIHQTELVPNRHGIALVDAIYGMREPLGGGGIFLNQVCNFIKENEKTADRTIVITDEQDCSGSNDSPLKARPLGKGYIINVNTYEYGNGIAYNNGWTHINGWSEAVLDYILANEALSNNNKE